MKTLHPVRHIGAPARPRMSLMRALEPRMLFDGAVAATVVDAGQPIDAQPDDTHAGDNTLAATPQGVADQRHEVVFIDSNVRDYQQLLAGMPSGTEVVILDADQDGLQQMADYLEGRTGIDAIHVLSHGDAGKIQLGNQWLDVSQLQARSDLLADIGESLSEDGDILLYGCNVGADSTGIDFISSLAVATGADVAASTDATGAADRDGNWVLETQTGAIEAVALDFGSYSALLAAFSDDMNNSGGNSNTFNRTLGGVSFTYTFTNDGDGPAGGGGLTYYNVGDGGSAAMTLLSADLNLATTEKVTITRTDLADFTFSSIYLDNPAGNVSVTVAGYLDGVLVSSQLFETGADTLNFGGIRVDEVRITSTDFYGLAIDNFAGDTNPPNAAPTINNLNGDSTTFTEGGSAVLLDVGSNATVTDADSADFGGGNVTVAITANGSAGEDVLAIRNEGTGTGQISVSGNTVSYGATAIGTITSSGTGGTSLVVTLNANANAAAVQALIHNLTYANSNDADPSTAARTVSITVNDGDGGTSTAAAVTVNVTGVNDAPAITATGNNPTYTENGSAADLFSNVSINTVETGQSITGMTLTVTNLADGSNEILRIDGTDILLVDGSGVTTGNGISYSVSLAGSTATITLGSAGGLSAATAQTVVDGMAYRNSSDAPSTATRVITLASITDNGGTANGGVDTTATSISTSVSVVAVNDVPIVTSSGGASTFTEGDGGTVIDSGLTLSDPDNATLSSATVSITGNFQSGDVLSFINDGSTMGNITASYNAGTGAMTLTSAGATATLAQWQAALRSVTYSNGSDAPSTANRTISFVANDGQDDSTPATKVVSVTAVNDAPQITAPVSIDVTEDMPSAITGISFSDVDAGSANVTVTLSIDSGSLTATSGGGVAVGGTASALTLTGSIANINSFIAGSNLSFTTAANTTAGVTLTVSINDGGNTGNGGAQSANETITLQVTAVNDAPTITAPGSIAITEDVAGALTGISFTDIDAGNGTATATFSVPSGTLSAASGNGVTVGGTASALTLTGSLADINAFIAASGITFTTASNATANVTLTVTIDDDGNTGSGGAQTDTTSVTLTVTAVNDAPVNSVPAAQSVDQDSALVFNNGNGNLISISDVDAGSSIVQVTLTATNGLLTLGNTAGLIFSVGSGSNDGTMTIAGSIADINNALNGLVFSPTGGYNGPASLQITTNDLGSSGSGGAQTDTDTVNITVNSLIPRVTDVSASTADGTYKVGDTITITATFSEAVTVDTAGGIPTLLLETGSVDRIATYVSGSGGNTLTFTYTVQAGDISADLNYHSTTALSLNGAAIRGATTNDAVLTLPALGDANSLAGNKAIIIDGVAATVSSVSVPANGTYVAGQPLDFTVNLSESVTVDTSGGTPRIAITLDTGGTVYASYVSGSGTSALVFRLTVMDGQMDSNGISLGSSIDANGGTLRDVAGNDTTTTLNTVGSTTGVLVDSVAPEVSAISLDGASPTNATSVTFTVTFTEDVSGVDINDFSLITSGSVNATLQSLVQIDPRTYQVTVDAITGLGSLGLNLNANGTGIVDAASNAITGGFTDGPTYAIDTNAPTAPVVTSPALTNAPTPMLSGTAEADSTVTVTIGGATYTTVASGGAWSLDLATATPAAGSLALNTNGANPVSVTATDTAGNVSSATTQTLVIDTTAPTTPAVTSPALTNALAPVLSGTAEAGSTVTVTIGGATYTIVASGGAWSLDLATATPAAGSLALNANGANPISVTSTDAAGNVSSATTQTLVIDTTAPEIPAVTSPTLTNVATPVLSGTAETGSTVTVTIGGATYTTVASGGAWSLDLATATPVAGNLALNANGANPVSVTATDAAGNVSSTTTQTLVIDTTAPSVPTLTSPALTNAPAPMLSGTAEAGSTVTVTIGGATYTTVTSGGAWSLDLATATPAAGSLALDTNGANPVSITATDTAGNVSSATTQTLVIDTTAPTTPAVTSPTLTNAPTPMLSGTAEAGSTVTVTIGGATYTTVASGGAWSLDLATATPAAGSLALNTNGANPVSVTATDTAGNVSSATTQTLVIDTTAPTTPAVTSPPLTNAPAPMLSGTAEAGSTVTVTIGGATYTTVASGGAWSLDLATATPVAGNLALNANGANPVSVTATDAAGNVSSAGSQTLIIDTQAPTIGSVTVPVGVHYNAGDTLTFVVNASEAVLVNGTPRLALDIGGVTVFADYVAGSSTSTLVFQYSVQAGLNDADGITVIGLVDNGGSIQDAAGNVMDPTLNNVGDTSGVIIDTTAPSVSAIVTLDPSPTNAGSVRYSVVFSENVSGVDLADFSLVTTGNVAGSLGSLVQIDSRTYQITIDGITGSGTLALALNASGTAIVDAAGNELATGLAGETYSFAQTQGDPEFRVNPPSHNVDIPSPPLQPTLPSLPPPPTTSPLLPPPLFEVPTLGSGIPTLGNIFINQNPLAPSYIAQVFASSSDSGGNGSGIGFLGFDGGDGGVFGSSSLSGIFGKEVQQEGEQLEVFDGNKWGAGNGGGLFGAPTLGQQLHDLHETEQRQHRELALALQQIAAAQPPA
ncbi:DUF4347 domain-containing protein [Pseudomonas saudiphocaensis]|uniref:DUF4347 domain-containing protein n=1 Tax=Pseudomonas saudiphocaensis TaxID=1499686 RepID=UPI000F796B9E|nr:DUF4347 domain-containing protein [Pseudomonas saudiphocaensis]RRV15606.1 DUF4347 domain-containing protein [Pseudomonas saudiphocaensis]